MEHIIGTKPCTILKVRDTMKKSPGQLYVKWKDFARELELTEDDILELSVHDQVDKKDYDELMRLILYKFQSKNGLNAKLSVVIEALVERGHQTAADKLLETFCDGSKTPAETVKPSASQKEEVGKTQTDEQKKIQKEEKEKTQTDEQKIKQKKDKEKKQKHIKANLEELIKNTDVNVTITVGLESREVLAPADVMALDILQHPFEKRKKLFEFMIQRCPKGYDELISLLRDACQDSAADILAEVYEN